MDLAGYYDKYHVTRNDGKPIDGRTFVIEIDKDPLAAPLLQAIAAVYLDKDRSNRGVLVNDLLDIAQGLYEDQDADRQGRR